MAASISATACTGAIASLGFAHILKPSPVISSRVAPGRLPLNLSAACHLSPSPLSRIPISRTSRKRTLQVSAAVFWSLEPAGDGDSSHLDEKVPQPGPFRLDKDAYVVGRVIERSDIVLGVPTVSGSHARVELKGDNLVVTDLNSTNGTFINDQRLRPGTPTTVPNGSIVTFGDQHLATFKITKVIEAVDV